ncbi:MAG: imidazolonepropionase-like amidohydrolase [Planctomycetota bacterium]|jgi:imidazolonepropionase-like amidohydrolase
MRSPIAACLLVFATFAQSTDLWITGGKLFDGLSAEVRTNVGVHIRDGRIRDVDQAAPEGANILRLEADETLLPGFIDLHAHHAIDLFERGRRDETRGYPAIFLANGVTSVFPAGEVNPEDMRALQLRLEQGEQIGPRLFRSGPYFGTWRKGWDRKISAEALRAEVDSLAAEGVTGLKAKGITPEHLKILVERAHKHGLRVTGHLDSGYRNSVNPRDAIALGIDRIEHFLGGDQMPASRSAYDSLMEFDVKAPAFKAICRTFIDKGVYFDVTLSAFGYYGERDPEVYTPWEDERSFFTPYVRELIANRPARPPMKLFEQIYWKKREHLLAFYELGGGPWITVGTDHASWGDYLSGFGFHRELHCIVLAGLPEHAALRAATINGARALGVDDRLGSLEPGKLADCIVVRGNPLADITVTRRVRWVVRGGVVHDAEKLLESSRGTLGPASEDEVNDW